MPCWRLRVSVLLLVALAHGQEPQENVSQGADEVLGEVKKEEDAADQGGVHRGQPDAQFLEKKEDASADQGSANEVKQEALTQVKNEEVSATQGGGSQAQLESKTEEEKREVPADQGSANEVKEEAHTEVKSEEVSANQGSGSEALLESHTEENNGQVSADHGSESEEQQQVNTAEDAAGPSDPHSAEEYQEAHGEDAFEDSPIASDQVLKLYKLWDHDSDGHVSKDDVLKFAHNIHLDMAKKSAHETLKDLDHSKDGTLSMEEAMSDMVDMKTGFAPDDSHEEIQAFKKKKFEIADANGDGVLDKHEVHHFFHPETHQDSLKLSTGKKLEDHDINQDGKLSAEEFIDYIDAGDDEVHDYYAAFKNLDKSGDGYVDTDELMHWESGKAHVEMAMTDLFERADKNKDGHVSVEELKEAHTKLHESRAHTYLKNWASHIDTHNDL